MLPFNTGASVQTNSSSSSSNHAQPCFGSFYDCKNVFWNFLVIKAFIKFYDGYENFLKLSEKEVILSLTGGYELEIEVNNDAININLEEILRNAFINGCLIIDKEDNLVLMSDPESAAAPDFNFKNENSKFSKFSIIHLSLNHLITSSLSEELEEMSIRSNDKIDNQQDVVLVLDGNNELDCYRLWINKPGKIYNKTNFNEFTKSISTGFYHLRPGRYLIKNADYCVYARFKRSSSITKYSSEETRIIKDFMSNSSFDSCSRKFFWHAFKENQLDNLKIKFWSSKWSKESGQAGGSSRNLKEGIFVGLAANPQILIELDANVQVAKGETKLLLKTLREEEQQQEQPQTDIKSKLQPKIAETYDLRLHLFKFKRCNNFGTGMCLYKIKDNWNPSTITSTSTKSASHSRGYSIDKETIESSKPIAITEEIDNNQCFIELKNLSKGRYVCIPFCKVGEECEFMLRMESLKNYSRKDFNMEKKIVLKRGRMQI